MLVGKSLFVLDFDADLYLVADHRKALYLVEAGARGVGRRTLETIDGTRSVGGTRGLARVEAPEGTFVLYSAGTGQAALDRLSDTDDNANSVFTRSLVPLIKTPGLPLQEVALKVREEVVALASSVGRKQTPAYYDQVIGRFCVAGCASWTT